MLFVLVCLFKYFLNYAGGGYEVYDPYTGNVTVLMGPPPGHYPPVGHPMLYQPLPLQAVDWYNPSKPSINEHCMPGGVYQPNKHHKKSTADAHQVIVYKFLKFRNTHLKNMSNIWFLKGSINRYKKF